MSALSTPELSPVLSPNTRARRLSARRGSVAACDPWGAHSDVNMNPSRSLTSRLTIVRVPHADVEEPPRRHRRHGSNASINSTSSGKGEGTPGSRLSFAFTSFSSPGSQAGGPGGRSASPSSPSSPRMRPASPSTSRFQSALPGHSKLSPDQVVDLARTSVNPRSPLPSPNGPLAAYSVPTPVSFTPLPESIYLPFIDRPAEVSTLISAQPNARLFALLQQTFPPDARAPMGSDYEKSKASPDSKEWTYGDLEFWLKTVDRDIAEDAHWVSKARRCIMAHSELIWERVKGALGVPPELDVDEEGLELQEEGPVPPVTTETIDANVFEPDSPVVSVKSEQDEDSIVIEPVYANQTPPHSAADPLGSSLGDLREEDESENAEEKKGPEEPVQGLRFTTSSSSASFLPEHAIPASPIASFDSPLVKPRFSAPAGSDDKDLPYDMCRERGPGHPLFPSNFAQLSLSPTLQPNKRTQSMSYPPRPAYLSPHSIRGGVHRTNSIDAGAGRASNMGRPDWARHYDPSKHEYAVTTASTGSFE